MNYSMAVARCVCMRAHSASAFETKQINNNFFFHIGNLQFVIVPFVCVAVVVVVSYKYRVQHMVCYHVESLVRGQRPDSGWKMFGMCRCLIGTRMCRVTVVSNIVPRIENINHAKYAQQITLKILRSICRYVCREPRYAAQYTNRINE